MKCLGCKEITYENNLHIEGEGHLCATCRADLELGRLVRAMKPGRVLTHAAKENEIEPEKPWESYSYVIEDGDCRFGGTPEEALKGAK